MGIYHFEEEARKAGEYTVFDETRREAFIKGVQWTIDSLERAVYSSHHPMASPLDNAHFDKLTLRDIKAFVKKMKTRATTKAEE